MSASSLQADLARLILTRLKDASPGTRLVELELCQAFGVSRTPVRGALKLLAQQGAIRPRDGRGYVLARPAAAPAEPTDANDEEVALFNALADARARGALPDSFTQQELVRRFSARLPVVVTVLRDLAELGLVERRPGNGWRFLPEPARALHESYAFRRALEPAMLQQPGFKLDRAWAEQARAQHLKFRAKPWRAGDGAAFHAINADFHEQLARCSGNRAMLKAAQRQNQLRHFLSRQWDYPKEQVHAAIDDHLEILGALEAGYGEKAAALMLHHLTLSASQSGIDEAAQ